MKIIIILLIFLCNVCFANDIDIQEIYSGSLMQPRIEKFIDGETTCYITNPSYNTASISCVINKKQQEEIK